MLSQLRKHLSPATVNLLTYSLANRLYSRLVSNRQEVRISCELTTKCNILCDFCTRTRFVEKENPQEEFLVKDMSDALVEKVLEEIERFHNAGTRVCFAPMGLGEQILYKKIFETCERVKNISKNIRIVLVTNGIKLTENDCEKILFYDLDEVSISLNTNKPSLYKDRMGLNKYEMVCNNIERLLLLRNKSGKKKPSIFIQYINFDDKKNNFSKDIQRWARVMKNNDKCYVHPLVNQAGFFPDSNFNYKIKDHFPCTQLLGRIAIKVNGDLYPCDPAFYSGGAKINSLLLGNIMNTSPYEMHLDLNSKPKRIARQMRKGDYSSLPECDSCNTYKLSQNIFFKIPLLRKLSGYKWF
jgi:radical SAM protein with 4Fe4S-binding SPASM domain